ncbi:hypothetical protein NWT09_12150 [Mycolicibacterium sp. jd]|uniref:hypothetical protein n=1 Tax=unclassified Mycolicibacterium TaxID=2636767 RepID=UPI00351B1398
MAVYVRPAIHGTAIRATPQPKPSLQRSGPPSVDMHTVDRRAFEGALQCCVLIVETTAKAFPLASRWGADNVKVQYGSAGVGSSGVALATPDPAASAVDTAAAKIMSLVIVISYAAMFSATRSNSGGTATFWPVLSHRPSMASALLG